MALLIPLLHEACSTVTPMSFLARDGPELWTCTEPQFPRRAELTAVIDGVGLTALERYGFPAELFTMALTEDNWAEAGPAVLEGIYGGSWLLLAPLPPGEHELRFSASLPHIGAFYEVTYHLTVANPTVVENRVGSPEVRPNPSATGTGTRVGSGRLLEEEHGTGFKNPRDLRGSTTWAWSSRC